MKRYTFNKLPSSIAINGNFDKTCEITLSEPALDSLKRKKLKITINQHGGKPVISGFAASIGCVHGVVYIFVGNDHARVTLGDASSGVYDIRLWRNSTVSIGAKTTSNGIMIICDNSEFVCGEDCMFSEKILIQAADQHGIVDISTGQIINNDHKSVTLGNHVWLGRQCTLTSAAQVGEGSIIGTGAIVTGKIPEKVVAAGIPARVIKENHTWSRSPVSLDDFAKYYIDNSR